MTAEKAELLADLRAVGNELFPYRRFDHWQPSDELLILGVFLRREILLRLPVKQINPAYAEGAEPSPTARPRGKRERVE